MAKTTPNNTKTSKRKKTSTVEVKNHRDVMSTINSFIAKNIHDRYNVTFSEATKLKIVAYAPWLAILILLVISPELIVLANNGLLTSPMGFLEKVLFNRDSWVLLIILLVNIICLVDGFGELFSKSIKGWNRIYFAQLVNSGYVIYQLFTQLDQPAAPLLSIICFSLILFTTLDVRRFYK